MEYSDSDPRNIGYVAEINSLANFNNLYLKLPQSAEVPRYEGMEDALRKKREELNSKFPSDKIANFPEDKRFEILTSVEKIIYSFLTKTYPLVATIDEFCIENPDFDYRGIYFLGSPANDSPLIGYLEQSPIIKKYWNSSLGSLEEAISYGLVVDSLRGGLRDFEIELAPLYIYLRKAGFSKEDIIS